MGGLSLESGTLIDMRLGRRGSRANPGRASLVRRFWQLAFQGRFVSHEGRALRKGDSEEMRRIAKAVR